jgi:hypothetical protein
MAAEPINTKQPGDCGYVFFFRGKEIALYAPSLAAAKDKAVTHFKAPKSQRHMVHGGIAEDKDGKEIVHTAD